MEAISAPDIFLIEKITVKIKINLPINTVFIGSVFELQVGFFKNLFQWN